MKKIPLCRSGNSLSLTAKINDAFDVDFDVDTGCSNTVISKEIADLLYLSGNLKDEDITGNETAFWGNHSKTDMPSFKIKKLSFGSFSIKNIKAEINTRYAAPTLFGMSCLDKLKGYAIKCDGIYISDGKNETKTIGHISKPVKNYVRFCHNRLEKLHKEREEHPEVDFKFDYKKWCNFIFKIITSCYKPLCKNKFDKVIPILEELRSLIKQNLEYDQEHPKERGAFITGYFNYYLATAYSEAKRMKEALRYYRKAKAFFLEGTPTRADIDAQMRKIENERFKGNLSIEYEPNIIPMRTMDLERDVKQLDLSSIEIIDNVYADGERKKVLTGFKDFKKAFDFSITYHKRLEIIKSIDGVWYRTKLLPIGKLSAFDLDLGETYFYCGSKRVVEDRAKELIEAIKDDDRNLVERIEQNKAKAIKAIETLPEEGYDRNVVLNKNDLSFDSVVETGCSLQWHDTDFTICAIDAVDDSIAKRLADDVLAGKFIPCAIGQMPEDFTFLNEKSHYFEISKEDDYAGDNNADSCKMVGHSYVVMDNSNCVGFSYRETYDDIHWRWVDGEHSNICMTTSAFKDINKNEDDLICFWQLVRERGPKCTNIISCKPY